MKAEKTVRYVSAEADSGLQHDSSSSIDSSTNTIVSTGSIDILLLIDVQVAFDDEAYWGSKRSNLAFESNIKELLTSFSRRFECIFPSESKCYRDPCLPHIP